MGYHSMGTTDAFSMEIVENTNCNRSFANLLLATSWLKYLEQRHRPSCIWVTLCATPANVRHKINTIKLTSNLKLVRYKFVNLKTILASKTDVFNNFLGCLHRK